MPKNHCLEFQLSILTLVVTVLYKLWLKQSIVKKKRPVIQALKKSIFEKKPNLIGYGFGGKEKKVKKERVKPQMASTAWRVEGWGRGRMVIGWDLSEA